MVSICVASLSPVVAVASLLLGNDSALCSTAFGSLTEPCSTPSDGVTQAMLDAVKRKMDDELLCTVMCCCTKHPNIGSGKGTNQRQGCVSSTLQAADSLLDHKSRYKAEVSYNMDTDPPSPFMHRDQVGKDTTQKSERWQTRAYQDIPGYRGGQGRVRRPDVVIVKDTSKPPTQDNIDRVVEMKFKGDTWGDGQEEAYAEIAGAEQKLTLVEEGEDCTCSSDDDGRQPQEVPVVVPEKEVDWSEVAETAGFATLTTLGALVTIAAALIPFDGPAGEVVAGSATALAAARTAAAFRNIFRVVAPVLP